MLHASRVTVAVLAAAAIGCASGGQGPAATADVEEPDEGPVDVEEEPDEDPVDDGGTLEDRFLADPAVAEVRGDATDEQVVEVGQAVCSYLDLEIADGADLRTAAGGAVVVLAEVAGMPPDDALSMVVVSTDHLCPNRSVRPLLAD